jgi:hypothetical protein
MGCPVPKITKCDAPFGARITFCNLGYGTSHVNINNISSRVLIYKFRRFYKWLLDPDKIYEMVSAVVDAVDKPVTVKMRMGWDEETSHVNINNISSRVLIYKFRRFYKGFLFPSKNLKAEYALKWSVTKRFFTTTPEQWGCFTLMNVKNRSAFRSFTVNLNAELQTPAIGASTTRFFN